MTLIGAFINLATLFASILDGLFKEKRKALSDL